MVYFPNDDRRTRLGRPPRYPWDEWMDGKERVFRQGENFDCMAESFVLLARRTARVHGMLISASTRSVTAGSPVKIQVEGEDVWLQPGGTYVILQFTKPEGELDGTRTAQAAHVRSST